jgi:integrase/recombinase XerC
MWEVAGLDQQWADAIGGFLVAQRAAGIARTSVESRRQHLAHMARRVEVGPWALDGAGLASYMDAQPWARETRRGRRTTLVEFYRWAVAAGHAASDPTAVLVRIQPSDPDPRPVPDRVYLEALVRADPVEAVWIDLAAEHGLRRSEVAVIQGRDIVETLLGHDLRVHGKGGKTRYVPLTRAMAERLLGLAQENGGRHGLGYVFPGDHDGHVSPQWVGKRVARLLGGIWTMHKLRHRAATRFWIAADGDPYAVADLMGWSNLNMVRVYVRQPDTRKRAIVEAASRSGARLLAHA